MTAAHRDRLAAAALALASLASLPPIQYARPDPWGACRGGKRDRIARRDIADERRKAKSARKARRKNR